MLNIVTSEYYSADKTSCIKLLKNIFPGTSDEVTFQWRFESSLRHQPIMICAKDQDKVVSFNSWLPWEFVYKNKIFLGYQSGESATYPEYRRKGILGKVLRYADEIAQKRNADFLFGFPSPMIYNTFYKAGYYPVGILPYRLRLINPFGKATVSKTVYGFNDFPQHTIIEYNKITPVNDIDYFDWRYTKNPKSYSILKYTENNNEAIFILRPSIYYNTKYHIRLNELLLLDCHFTSYNEIFIRNAFKHIDKTYKHKASYLKGFINTNTDRGRAISQHFHLTIKSRHEIQCIKPIAKELDRSIFFNHNNWDLLPHIVDEM
jgi:GNAT superfamily N-acetyltransferase